MASEREEPMETDEGVSELTLRENELKRKKAMRITPTKRSRISYDPPRLTAEEEERYWASRSTPLQAFQRDLEDRVSSWYLKHAAFKRATGYLQERLQGELKEEQREISREWDELDARADAEAPSLRNESIES
jgi:hypothetical protein